jgi:phosphoglycolate phosphatase-like HAD superfamily hydrolase
MKEAIALDYDGVIADTNQVKSDWIAQNLSLEVPPWLCNRTECVPIIGLENYNRMSPIVYGREASLRARPMTGVLEAVQALRQTYRLAIVTARTEEQIEWTREWLAQQGIEGVFESIHSSSGGIAKADIVRQLGAIALIEDDIRHLLKALDVRFARIHLVPHGEGEASHPGIVTVRDWMTLVTALKELNGGKA